MPKRTDRTGLTAKQRAQYDKYLDSIGALNYQGGPHSNPTGSTAVPDWILKPEKPQRDNSAAAAAAPASVQPPPMVPPPASVPPTIEPLPSPSTGFEDIKPAVQALLPFFSRKDRTDLESYYGVSSENIPSPSTDSRWFTSQGRAEQALNALNALNPSGQKGAGYAFLEQAINLMKKYGGVGEDSGMSSANAQQFNIEMNNLLSNANQTNLAPFRTLAQMFASPSQAAPTQKRRSTRLFI